MNEIKVMAYKRRKKEKRESEALTGSALPLAKHVRRTDHQVAQLVPRDRPGPNDRITGEHVSGPFMSKPEKTTRAARCNADTKLRWKAKEIVRFLETDLGIKSIRKLPSFNCGGLRAAIRQVFPDDLTLSQELSIKTSMKVEKSICTFCAERKTDVIQEWIEKRKEVRIVDDKHLERFTKAFRMNIPDDWTKDRACYIPNGHATKDTKVCDGGNWVPGEFSTDFSTVKIITSGKERIITMYSEFNTRVLTPLHTSLYRGLQRRGWLLVGSPKPQRLRQIRKGLEDREWLSYDYIGATDNINTAYVRRAVEELIKQAPDLTEDEKKCLRALVISFEGMDAGTGQPMGSAMSFPLLCLINKTVVDLALTDLMESGEISFREWKDHPCLINGDDLLTLNTSKGDFNRRIVCNGLKVGLQVNQEKTLRSREYAEINSTVFKNCVLQKKSNVSALWMSHDVMDPIGYAYQSSRTKEGFRMLIRNNASRLRYCKTFSPVPFKLKRVCVNDRKVRKYLCTSSSYAVLDTNCFPCEIQVSPHNLTKEEVADTIGTEVERVRKGQIWRTARKNALASKAEKLNAKFVYKERTKSQLLRSLGKVTQPEKRILSCLARAGERKIKEKLADEGYDEPALIISDLSGIESLLDAIKAWRQPSAGVRPHTEHHLGDYVSFADTGW